jgi:glutathione S-transferase
MKLYDSVRAPNPRRVRIFLAEKGLDIPREVIDLAVFQHREQKFEAINSLKQTPALVLDDGTVITESVAICRYFEEIQPEPPLFGATAKGKALIEMWNRRIELGLFNAVAAVFRHGHPGMAKHEVPQVFEWAEANRPKVLEALIRVDQALAHSPFIAGDSYSIADITLLCAIDFMKPTKITVPDTCEHVKRWHAEMSARPSSAA